MRALTGPVKVLAVVVAVVVAALVGLQVVGSSVASSVIDRLTPFDERTTDRSQRPLLTSIRDVSRYTAAVGTYEQVVDLENDRDNVPDFLSGDRTLFVAAGTVEVYVDFADLDAGALSVDPADATRVAVALPTPRLEAPVLDLDDSYVYDRQRGLLDRIEDALGDGGAEDQEEVYRRARADIAEAASRQDRLVERAEANTRQFLQGLLGGLGYTEVTVTFS